MKATFTKTKGIVLRSFYLQEADLGLEVFTEGLGIVKVSIKGIRKTKRRSRLPFELGSITEYDFYNHNREWKMIKNYNLLFSPDKLRGDYKGLIILTYITQLFYKNVLPGQPEMKFYQLLEGALYYLQSHPFYFLLILFVKLRLVSLSGLLPDFSVCHSCNKKVDKIIWQNPYESWLCEDCNLDKSSLALPPLVLDFLREAPFRKYGVIEEKFVNRLTSKNDLYFLDEILNIILEKISEREIKCSDEFYRIAIK